MIVGADTQVGLELAERFAGGGREVRAFVSDPGAAKQLRSLRLKVATGDVSDDSHVSGACMGCFSAVLITAAATDARERNFADSPESVLASWARAVEAAGVQRVIWVGDAEPPPVGVAEIAVVDPAVTQEAVGKIYEIDAATTLGQ